MDESFSDITTYGGRSDILNIDQNSTLEELFGLKDLVLQTLAEDETNDFLKVGGEESNIGIDIFDDLSNPAEKTRYGSVIDTDNFNNSPVPLFADIFTNDQENTMASQLNLEMDYYKLNKSGACATQLQSIGSVQSADKIPSLTSDQESIGSPTIKTAVQCKEGPQVGSTGSAYDNSQVKIVKLHDKLNGDREVKLHGPQKGSIGIQYTLSNATYPAMETNLKQKKEQLHKLKPYSNSPAVAVSKCKKKFKEMSGVLKGNDQQAVVQLNFPENQYSNSRLTDVKYPSISNNLEGLAIQVQGPNIDLRVDCYEETIGEASSENDNTDNVTMNQEIIEVDDNESGCEESNPILIPDNDDVNKQNTNVQYNFRKTQDGASIGQKVVNNTQIGRNVARKTVPNVIPVQNFDTTVQTSGIKYITLANSSNQIMNMNADQLQSFFNSSQTEMNSTTNGLTAEDAYLINEVQIQQSIDESSKFPYAQAYANNIFENNSSSIDQDTGNIQKGFTEVIINNTDQVKTSSEPIRTVYVTDTNTIANEIGYVTIPADQYKELVEKSNQNNDFVIDLEKLELGELGDEILRDVAATFDVETSHEEVVDNDTLAESNQQQYAECTSPESVESFDEDVSSPQIPESPKGCTEYESFSIPSTVEEMAALPEDDEQPKKGDGKNKKITKPKLTKKTDRPQRSIQKPLWEFLLDVLADKRHNPSVIKWIEHKKGTFKIVKGEELAHLWTAARNRHDANLKYEFFARAMRHYYKKGILKRMTGKKLQYLFCETFDWHTYDKQACANQAQ